MTPCNQHQQRFERLYDSLKVATREFEEEFNESWLGVAVSFWDTFDARGKCSHKKRVDSIVYEELNKTCSSANTDVANSARCSMCYPLWQMRYAEDQ